LSSSPSQILFVPFTTKTPELVPETTKAVPKLNPFVASLILVGALKASALVVCVEVVERYIATRSSPEVHVVVVPSMRTLEDDA
jgi:hypothetical protein